MTDFESVQARHVAVITAAVLAATHGQGRISSITQHSRVIPEVTQRWRTASLIESVERRLAPSWKR